MDIVIKKNGGVIVIPLAEVLVRRRTEMTKYLLCGPRLYRNLNSVNYRTCPMLTSPLSRAMQ
jgi:hypothetical protein